jgi:hypothetical protein
MLTQTRINRKKYVNGSVNLKGNLNKIKIQARRSFRPISMHLCQNPNPTRDSPFNIHIHRVYHIAAVLFHTSQHDLPTLGFIEVD